MKPSLDVIYEEDDIYSSHIEKFQDKFNDILKLFHITNVNEFMCGKSYKSGNMIYDFIYDYTRDYVNVLPQKTINEIITIYGLNKAFKRLYKHYENTMGETNWEFCENIKSNNNIDRQIVVMIFKDELGMIF